MGTRTSQFDEAFGLLNITETEAFMLLHEYWRNLSQYADNEQIIKWQITRLFDEA